jgi:hypothetical protein
MKRFLQISVAVMAVIMACATAGQAERFHGGGWGWGPALGIGLLGLGLWEATYPHYVYPEPVIVQQPVTEVYVQPAPRRSAESGYWYYCQNPEGYYPYVRRCPNGWMKVVPSPPQR